MAVVEDPSVGGTPIDSTLTGLLDEFTRVYGMQFFILFVSFSVLAYISFPTFKKKVGSFWRFIIFSTSVALYLRAVLFAVWLPAGDNTLAIQVIVFFLIPLAAFLYLRLSSHYVDLFQTNGNDVYKLLAIFVIVSFIPYLVYAQITGRTIPEARIIVFSLYMLIPLSIIGIMKLLNISFHFLSDSVRRRVVSLSLVAILIIFSFTQTWTGIDKVNAFQSRFAEVPHQTEMNQWIIENIPADAKIASDLPHVVLLRTGHEAVNFQFLYKDNISYERWIFKKFDIDYLVFYYYYKDKTPIDLSFTDLGDMRLEVVYRADRGLIYKVN